MRILSGEAKGRVLKTREGKGTRPTDSRSREALFNIIGARVVGARVLDLYAGSGAIGLEALSRGAQGCVFVEQNAGAAASIRQNVRACERNEQAQVWLANVKSALKRLRDEEQSFDIIFADPPFSRPNELKDLCGRLDSSPQLLHNGESQSSGLLVIQHHWKAQLAFGQTDETAPISSRWRLVQERRAGDSMLSFFQTLTNL